jgi:hypothetical protein
MCPQILISLAGWHLPCCSGMSYRPRAKPMPRILLVPYITPTLNFRAHKSIVQRPLKISISTLPSKFLAMTERALRLVFSPFFQCLPCTIGLLPVDAHATDHNSFPTHQRHVSALPTTLETLLLLRSSLTTTTICCKYLPSV